MIERYYPPAVRLKIITLQALLGLPPLLIHALLWLGLKRRFYRKVCIYNEQRRQKAEMYILLPSLHAVFMCFVEGALRWLFIGMLLRVVF